MERRLHPRTQVQFEARLTNRAKAEQSFLGRLCDLSESGLSVVLPVPFEPADLVELEVADSLLVGRVIYSNPENGSFRIGIEIDKVKLGNSDLSNLLQQTLMESMPSVPGVEEEIHFR